MPQTAKNCNQRQNFVHKSLSLSLSLSHIQGQFLSIDMKLRADGKFRPWGSERYKRSNPAKHGPIQSIVGWWYLRMPALVVIGFNSSETYQIDSMSFVLLSGWQELQPSSLTVLAEMLDPSEWWLVSSPLRMKKKLAVHLCKVGGAPPWTFSNM